MDLEFINSYTRILFEDDYKGADEFKNKAIPEVLFKYFPCRKNRLDALFDQKLWLAQHETFNDPNEFAFMYIDHEKFHKAKLIGSKWNILFKQYDKELAKLSYQDAENILKKIRNSVYISCFTIDPDNDYFWSEYADSSNGFCVEYAISRKDLFYPVIYTDDKKEISDILKTFIAELQIIIRDENELKRNYDKNYNIISDDGMRYLSFLYFNFCCKEKKWENENEYRVVFANNEIKQKGKSVSYEDLGIVTKKIYIGKNCSEKDKGKLKEIAKKMNAEYIYN